MDQRTGGIAHVLGYLFFYLWAVSLTLLRSASFHKAGHRSFRDGAKYFGLMAAAAASATNNGHTTDFEPVFTNSLILRYGSGLLTVS